MPLSKLGKKMKRTLIEEYGEKRGEKVFYAMLHEKPKWHKKWRKGQK